jgi:hypothetical protein
VPDFSRLMPVDSDQDPHFFPFATNKSRQPRGSAGLGEGGVRRGLEGSSWMMPCELQRLSCFARSSPSQSRTVHFLPLRSRPVYCWFWIRAHTVWGVEFLLGPLAEPTDVRGVAAIGERSAIGEAVNEARLSSRWVIA